VNAITLLKQDHGNVETLFKRFEELEPDAHDEKRQVVDLIIEQLSRHAAAEEQLLYPRIREAIGGDAASLALEGLEEHHVAKMTLNELEKLPPSADRFDAKVSVLIESVRHHVEEEEQELFPLVRKHLKASELDELGEAMEKAKEVAPSRPHPFMPDQPPFNVILGLPLAVLDRAVNTGKDVVGEVVHRLKRSA
jgi:hemerythrin superfamily protein